MSVNMDMTYAFLPDSQLRQQQSEAHLWEYRKGPHRRLFRNYRPGTFVNRETGEVVGAIPHRTKGGWIDKHPVNTAVGSKVYGQKLVRRRSNLRAGVKFLTSPGILGFGFGVILPWLKIGLTAKLVTSATVGAAGYFSKPGSWMRKFSIGAGVGGGLSSSIQIYRAGLLPSVAAVGEIATDAVYDIGTTIWKGFWKPVIKSGMKIAEPFVRAGLHLDIGVGPLGGPQIRL